MAHVARSDRHPATKCEGFGLGGDDMNGHLQDRSTRLVVDRSSSSRVDKTGDLAALRLCAEALIGWL